MNISSKISPFLSVVAFVISMVGLYYAFYLKPIPYNPTEKVRVIDSMHTVYRDSMKLKNLKIHYAELGSHLKDSLLNIQNIKYENLRKKVSGTNHYYTDSVFNKFFPEEVPADSNH